MAVVSGARVVLMSEGAWAGPCLAPADAHSCANSTTLPYLVLQPRQGSATPVRINPFIRDTPNMHFTRL